jgi:type IV secretion system protein VirB6
LFRSFSGELVAVFQASGVLGVAMIGANLVLQIHPMTMASGVAFILRFTVVFLLATSWDNFDIIFKLLTDFPDRLGAHIMGVASRGSIASADGLNVAMDSVVDRISDVATNASSQSSYFGISLVGVLVGFLAALVACASVLVIALGKVGLAFMIAMGPLALLASLFKPTKSMFESWSQATIGFAMIPMVTAGIMGIIVTVSEQVMADSAADVSTIGEATGIIVIALAAIFMLIRIPEIVRSMSGSIIAVGNGFTEGRAAINQGRATVGNAVAGYGMAVAAKNAAPAAFRGASDRVAAAGDRIRSAMRPSARK